MARQRGAAMAGGHYQRKRKGVIYFASYEAAQATRDRLRRTHPEARIVGYRLGYAVQYRKSGPYYPEPPGRG